MILASGFLSLSSFLLPPFSPPPRVPFLQTLGGSSLSHGGQARQAPGNTEAGIFLGLQNPRLGNCPNGSAIFSTHEDENGRLRSIEGTTKGPEVNR